MLDLAQKHVISTVSFVVSGLLVGGCFASETQTDSASEQIETTELTNYPGESTENDSESQNPSDAARDGIVPEVAALGVGERINQVPEVDEVVTPSGTWVVSQAQPEEPFDGVICALGDSDGLYGVDWICPASYAEILLLDPTSGHIVRAYPFPDLKPQQLFGTDEAIYFIRQGDGAVPDSMIGRIDTETLEIRVNVIPSSDRASAVPEALPEDWRVLEPNPAVLWQTLNVDQDGITVSGTSGSARIMPDTLDYEILD